MRILRVKRRMISLMVFAYVGILSISIAYAAVNGVLNITGTATTQADLRVAFGQVYTVLPSVYGSKATATFDMGPNSEKVMKIVVEMHAPGDMAHVIFDIENKGKLPAEFEDPIITVSSVKDDADVVYEPIMIEDYSDTDVKGFSELDGYVLHSVTSGPVGSETSEKFGIAFIWDEDVQFETGPTPATPVTFTIEIPYIIADITQ